jgi:hypothetical protein
MSFLRPVRIAGEKETPASFRKIDGQNRYAARAHRRAS